MTLSKKIISLLTKKKLKLSVAESCTGGKLSSNIVSVKGASKVFSLGLITYSNKAKIDILKIPKKTIKNYGAVSLQCCLNMVQNLNKISNSQVCLAITGIAGPKGGSKKKPVGLVFIGIKINKKIIIKKFNFKNKGRLFIQNEAVKKALSLIYNHFQNV